MSQTIQEAIEVQANIIAMFQSHCWTERGSTTDMESLSAALKNHCEVLEVMLRVQTQMNSSEDRVNPTQAATPRPRAGASYINDGEPPRTVVLFRNGTVMAFNNCGEQMPEFQGDYPTVAKRLWQRKDLPDIHFQKGVWGESLEDITVTDFFEGGMTLFDS